MKKIRQKKFFIYKIVDLIYLIFKSITLFLVPNQNEIRKIAKKIRRFRLSSTFSILIFGFGLILFFFMINPIRDFGIDLANNQRFINSYIEWEENVEDDVEEYTKFLDPEYFVSDDYEKWVQGEPIRFQIDTEEITRINEQDSTIRIKGKVEATYRPEFISSVFIEDGPITSQARKDILSIAEMNFASTEERRFEPISEVKTWQGEWEGWKSTVYRFEGDFPLERDLTKFPFDKAVWRVRLIFPELEPYAINPEFMRGSVMYNFSKINAFEPDYMTCENALYTENYEKYIACTHAELFERLTYPASSYEDKEDEFYQPAQVDFNLVLTTYGRLKRSLSSSFVRYLMPIIFSVMVLSLTDQLISRESWEIKIATPPTVLLTLIFMQNSYHAQIPQLGYITWLDELYLLAYFACILMLINALVSKGDWFNKGKIDIDARLKLNYLIRNLFVLVVIVMPFLTYLT